MCYWGTGIHLYKVFLVFEMTVLEVTGTSPVRLKMCYPWGVPGVQTTYTDLPCKPMSIGLHLWGCGNSFDTMLREPGGSWRWNPFRPEADGWAWANRRFHMLSTRTCNILRLWNSSIPSCGIRMLLLPGKMISFQADRQPGVILAQKQPLRTRRRTTVRPSSYTSNTFPYSQLGFLIGVGWPLATSSHCKNYCFHFARFASIALKLYCCCLLVQFCWHSYSSYDISGHFLKSDHLLWHRR